MATEPTTGQTTTERGKFASSMPTNGTELMQTWGLPPETWDTLSVKVSRQMKGTERLELLMSIPLSEYDLGLIAKDFGPGRYQINPGPGVYSSKVTTIQVSSEFARREGWAAPPMQVSPSEVMAQRTFHQAQQGPVDPVALSQMIELAILKSKEADRSTARPDNGMDALTLVMKGFELAGTMQRTAAENLRAMSGLPVGGAEKEPSNAWDVLREVGPSLLSTIEKMISAPRPLPAQAPMQAPMRTIPASQKPIAPGHQENITISQPSQQETQAMIIPAITEEEQKAIAPLLGVLKPHASQLAPYLASPIQAGMLAGELCGLLGPGLDGSILALDAVIDRVGPGILAIIHPDMATKKGGEVVKALAVQIINEERDDAD